MLLRRILSTSAVGLLALACEPPIPKEAPPSAVTEANFDPNNGQLPLPNDLLFQADLTTLGLPAAQVELLNSFKAQGGYPNDQEVAVTIDFSKNTINADGSVSKSAPDLDLTSFTPATLLVFAQASGGAGSVALDPIAATDYQTFPDHGTLTLHHQGRLPWAPGKYGILVRGGPNGVHDKDGSPVYASQIFYLVAQGADMTLPQNVGLLAAQAGSQQAAIAQGAQLNQLIAAYKPLYAVADRVFPHQELAIVVGFTIAPAVTQVQLDPGRGLVPLPIDLLRNPVPGGKLTALAACTFASGHLDATGACLTSTGAPNAAAAGFASLDGFSTTGAILAPTSELILGSTVVGGTLTPAAGSPDNPTILLYDLTNPAAPVRVDPATFITEPCEFTSSCGSIASELSPVIALQPAGATALTDPSFPKIPSVFRTRPLKDNTDYAVVITNGVKDKAGHGLGAGTVAKILLFDNAISAGGKSQLSGVDDNTAGALEVMRQQLKPVVGALAALSPSVPKANIAMAYTFHTETILSVAAQLGALPYRFDAPGSATPPLPKAPGAVTALTPVEAFTKYGLNTQVPHSHIAEFLETTITTFNLLDPASGAFNPNPSKIAPETIKVLISVPMAAAGAPTVAPLMIFRHGLGGGRADMLAIADSYAAAGMVTVAIDAAKHGDRSFCTPGVTSVNVPGLGTVPICAAGTCKTPLPAGAQGDASPPGVCVNNDGSPGAFFKVPVGCNGDAACFAAATDGIPLVSANYLVSANFFRTRDTLRQDIIDQSQLIRSVVLTPPNPITGPTGHTVFDRLLFTDNVIINPLAIYYSGQSLGAIQGTVDVAANPRITKAVLNVGGGTIVDIFSNSPAFKSGTDQLLAGLGITPGTAAYLQFLVIAKTILDPADPVNFASHITGNNLPNLLADPKGTVAQSPKKLLTQIAFCDQVVPNPFGFIWASTAGTSPNLVSPTFGLPGNFELFYKGDAAPTPAELGACPAPGGTNIPASAVTHGFILDWVDANITGKAQADAAAFVVSDTLPGSLQVIP